MNTTCGLEDKGESLIESIKTGLGPQGLSFFDRKPFTTLESRWISFMNALEMNASEENNNCSLKFLKIMNMAGRHGYEILVQALLADALPKNNGIVELSIRFVSFAQWKNVLQAISAHTTLRKLD
jgi:hypothetical protein